MQFLNADETYALGYNLNRISQYPEAYSNLKKSIDLRGDEPVFKDEQSFSAGAIAVLLASDKQATQAAQFAKEAYDLSNEVTIEYPNNLTFWKTRVRLLTILGELDKGYYPFALQAIQKAAALAPTDAKVSYTLGIIYGKNNNSRKAVETLENTVRLKPDYKDAYYALGLYYHELAIDPSGKVIHPELQKKAETEMNYILIHLSKNDKQAQDALNQWVK